MILNLENLSPQREKNKESKKGSKNEDIFKLGKFGPTEGQKLTEKIMRMKRGWFLIDKIQPHEGTKISK